MRKYWLRFGVLVVILIGVVSIFHAQNAQASDQTNEYAFVVRDTSAAPDHIMTEHAIVSHYTVPDLALLENGIPFRVEDKRTTSPGQIGVLGGVIYIQRTPLVHLIDGKKGRDIASWATTVQDVLTEQNVPAIARDDKVSLSLTTPITDGMNITIVRVQETDVIETQSIPFTTVTKQDGTVLRGQTKTTQIGKNGTKEITHHLRREDGVTVSDKVTKTVVTIPKMDQTIVIGTKLLIGQVMSGNASWYSSSFSAASHVLPRGTDVLVTNLVTHKSIELKIDDHMAGSDKIIDLNPSIFTQLGGTLAQGLQPVKVEVVLN